MFNLLTNPDPLVIIKLEKDPNVERFRLRNGGKLFQIQLDAFSALRPNDLKTLLENSVDVHFNDDVYAKVLADPKHSATRIRRIVHKCIRDFKY